MGSRPLGIPSLAPAGVPTGAVGTCTPTATCDDLPRLSQRRPRACLALLKERWERDGLGTSEEVPARQFRLHLHRDIGHLAAPQSIRSISNLIRLATEKNAAAS